ncbi:hypothetical protein B0H14DRAFT_2601869 [Mycena olivaceomarginata]|nr:hypothetical protein B0H14DRAFT_2601869 [Mycena olivaceomarginata]
MEFESELANMPLIGVGVPCTTIFVMVVTTFMVFGGDAQSSTIAVPMIEKHLQLSLYENFFSTVSFPKKEKKRLPLPSVVVSVVGVVGVVVVEHGCRVFKPNIGSPSFGPEKLASQAMSTRAPPGGKQTIQSRLSFPCLTQQPRLVPAFVFRQQNSGPYRQLVRNRKQVHSGNVHSCRTVHTTRAPRSSNLLESQFGIAGCVPTDPAAAASTVTTGCNVLTII